MTTQPHRHVLRTVRILYGISQQKFATSVGCSLTTIKQIEAGRLRPGADLTHRIHVKTGLSPVQLLDNSSPETPLRANGQQLTKDFAEAMQHYHKESTSQEEIDATLAYLQTILTTLLDASIPSGKLWTLLPTLREAITKLTKEFGLESDFRRLLFQRFGIKNPWLNVSPGKNLSTIVNAKQFETQREHARQMRRDFYALQAAKNGKPDHGKRNPGIDGTDSTAARKVPNSIEV